MDGRAILELLFGICVTVAIIMSFIAMSKGIFEDKDDYTDCEV